MKILIVFVIFQNYKYLGLALHAKEHLRANSNAFDVADIKFYVEERLLNMQGFLPVFKEDCIPFTNTFTKDPKLHSERTNLGLCLLPLIDERLSHYDRIIILDADLFLMSNYEKLDITEFSETITEKEIGVRRGEKINLADGIPRNFLNKAKYSQPERWKALLNEINVDIKPDAILDYDSTAYIIASPKFTEHYPDFSDFCRKGIQYLRDDEAILTAYQYQKGKITKHLPQYFVCHERHHIEKTKYLPYYFYHWRQF